MSSRSKLFGAAAEFFQARSTSCLQFKASQPVLPVTFSPGLMKWEWKLSKGLSADLRTQFTRISKKNAVVQKYPINKHAFS